MKYTAEEVRAVAKRLHDDITVADGDALMASDMLTDYAGRIKVGVSDADVDAVIESVSHINTDGMDGDSWDRILVRAALEHFTKGDRYE